MSVPSLSDALTNAHNVAFLGATQTGKTSCAREMYEENERISIWVNERGKHEVPNLSGVRCRTLREVKQAFANDETRINFLPADRNAAIVELQEWLWEVADRTDRQLPIQVFVDELDRVAPQSGKEYGNHPSRDAVRDFTSEGVKRNIKFAGITQDPATTDKQALGNSRYRAVWPMSNERFDAVSNYGFDRKAIREAPEYAGVMHYMDGTVLGTVKAEARYA